MSCCKVRTEALDALGKNLFVPFKTFLPLWRTDSESFSFQSIPDEDYTRTDLKWKADVDEEPFEVILLLCPWHDRAINSSWLGRFSNACSTLYKMVWPCPCPNPYCPCPTARPNHYCPCPTARDRSSPCREAEANMYSTMKKWKFCSFCCNPSQSTISFGGFLLCWPLIERTR